MPTHEEALLAKLTARISAAPRKRPALQLVRPSPPGPPQVFDTVTRESHLRLIRSFQKAYRGLGMDLIVSQALLGKGSLDDLEDQEIIDLHANMRRALDCIANDVSFYDAGLLRHQPGG